MLAFCMSETFPGQARGFEAPCLWGKQELEWLMVGKGLVFVPTQDRLWLDP